MIPFERTSFFLLFDYVSLIHQMTVSCETRFFDITNLVNLRAVRIRIN